MNDLIYQPLTALIQGIRNRQFSSVELVAAHIQRIEAVNPKLNAVVRFLPEQALDEARKADIALARGESSGILHGIPMTIKDSLDTAGIITTAGTKGREHFIPDKDATVVARLKNVGAILLGKTNTPELTLLLETDNFIFGRTNNPYDVSRIPGGSSGGASAIIASGGSPFDIGTDYGGSIRQPAHFCGIAGIKPTNGRVSRTGHILDFRAGATESYQTIGPMARMVADLDILLALIAGPDGIDPYIHPVPLHPMDSVDTRTLRVVYHTDNGVATPIPEIIKAVQNAVHIVSNHVALVEEKQPKGLEHTERIWRGIAGADGGKVYRDVLHKWGTEQPSIQWINNLQEISSAQLNALLIELAEFRTNMLAFMADYDVMVAPINADIAPKHGTSREHIENFSYAYHYNLTGHPAVVVRAGTSTNGLPIGVQVIAKHWREDHALAIARIIESELGGWQPPPL
jgi:amidase